MFYYMYTENTTLSRYLLKDIMLAWGHTEPLLSDTVINAIERSYIMCIHSNHVLKNVIKYCKHENESVV